MMAILAGTACGTTAVGAVAGVAAAPVAAGAAAWATRPGVAMAAASARARGRERFMRCVELLTTFGWESGICRMARCLYRYGRKQIRVPTHNAERLAGQF